MAYISSKCVTCMETTKRRAGEYKGRDERGRRFFGKLFLCEKEDCEINLARTRAERDMRYSGSILSRRKRNESGR